MAAFDGDRPQVGNLAAPEQLRAPQFVDQPSAGAPRPPIDDTLGQLASALGQFNTAVGDFGRYYQIDQRSHPQAQNQVDEQAVSQFQATKTPQEAMAAFSNGTAPQLTSPIAQRKLAMIHGTYAAQQLSDQLNSQLGSGTLRLDNGSAQAWAEQQRETTLQKNGWAPDSGEAAGFGAAYNQLQSKLGQAAVGAVHQNMANDHSQGVSQAVEMAVKAAYEQHLDPTATWQKVAGIQGQLLKGIVTTPAEVDSATYQALMRRSGEDPNWVLSVGNAPRLDPKDGKSPAPALFSESAYMTPAANLAFRAHAADLKAADSQAQDMTTAQVGELLQRQPEAIAELPAKIAYSDPAKGVSGEIDKQAAITAAVNGMLRRDNTRVAMGQATALQVQDEQLSVFARAGLRQHQWADTLNDAGKGGLDPQTLTDPSKQGQALAAYQLYGSLRAKNPAYLQTLLSPEASRFFTTAYTQQTLFGRTPIEAMQASAQVNAAPKDAAEANVLSAQRDQVDNAARSLDFGTGFFGPSIRNPYIARQALGEVATDLVRLNGMAPADAIKAAVPIVQNHYVAVNGSLVPSLGYLPKEMMKPAAEKWLSDWATGPAKALHLDPSSVTIAPTGNPGQYMVVDGASGMPIAAPRTSGNGRGGFTYVTAADLVRSGQALVTDAHAAQATKLNDAADRAAAAIRDRKAPDTFISP